MKHPLLAVTVALVAGCAAPPPGELQPNDFAYGMAFDAKTDQPFVRVAVPELAYMDTVWPDLRDIRVFNAAGEPVPFARIAPSPAKADARRILLRSFKLESANPGRLPRVELDTGTGGVLLRVAPDAVSDTGVEYLLATAEADEHVRVERLDLAWPEVDKNWQQTVTVSVSRDLQSWNTVAFRRPLLDLRTADGERLTHGEIPIDASTQQSGRYWRLHFDPGFAPALTGVEGVMTPDDIPAPGVPVPGRVERQPDGSVVYHLDRTHPIARLRMTPQDVNSVLPVLIEGRQDDKDKWEFLASSVAYRINTGGGEQFSGPVRLHGRMVGSFRVRPFGTSWGSLPPTISPERDASILVINARGTGPFLLAWGSRAAADVSVDLAVLVPGGREAVAKLEDSPLGSRQELGGASRLTALAPAERAARWQTSLVWVALVGGALALAFLAWRLLKETQAAQ